MDVTPSGKRKTDAPPEGSSKKTKQDVLAEAPREVDVVKYAESHAAEILVLSDKVNTTGTSKNITQRLPAHMRRRALSHNVKRLPHSIRAKAGTLIGNKIKTPRRYHRRRPKNLLQEYNRRQRKHVWLETHIWHAKRFHMVEKWGYKLPWKPTMKSERACYRAATKHCLIQDQSYMSCVEIIGPQDKILEGLAHVTSPNTGCTFAAVSCLAGTREGHTVIYEYDKYPWNTIGPVTFMWNPSQPITVKNGSGGTNQRQLWIWCHPCSFDQIWQEFSKCLNLTETKVEKSSFVLNKSDTQLCNKEITNLPDSAKTPFICDKYKTDVVCSGADNGVSMRSLTGSLLRFNLTGPQSTAVLVDTLQQANIVPVCFSGNNEPWWKGFYGNPKYSMGHVTQREFMESIGSCQSPSELPPRCVVGLTTRDPRLTRPSQRTKVVAEESDAATFREQLSAEVSSSPLWVEEIRHEVSTNIISDHKINDLKSQNIVPGFPLDLGDEESRVPVIVIQRPGVMSASYTQGHDPNLGRGGGFDLLLPKGWGMAFWLAFVYRGARCAGLRERESNAYEEKALLFPNDFPDTAPGRQHQLDLEQEKVDKYNRVPPAKRPNFTKYGVVSPFICPWDLLVKEWQEVYTDYKRCNGERVHSTEDGEMNGLHHTKTPFYVLRDTKVLRRLQNLCQPKVDRKGQKMGSSNKNKQNVDVFSALKQEHNSAIIPVKLDLLQKGCPNQFSMVCLPTNKDLEQLLQNKNYGGPVEPLQPDPILAEKKEMKRQMKVNNVKGKPKVDRNLKMTRDKMNVKVKVGTRDVIGYLNSGGFSLGTGNGGGVGFVVALGLCELLKHCVDSNSSPIVLVRDNSSLQYRFARLSVVV